MIESIRAVNFRVHTDVTVCLGRWTVLYGTNGSGKSSVLDALNIVSSVLDGANVEVLFPGVYALDRQMCDEDRGWIQFEVSHLVDQPYGHPAQRILYRLVLAHKRGRAYIESEELEMDGAVIALGRGDGVKTTSIGRCSEVDPALIDAVRATHNFARRYRLFPDSVRKRADASMHFIRRDGEGLPAAMAYDAQQDPKLLSSVVSALREVDASMGDVRAVPSGGGEFEFEFDSVHRSNLSGAYLSDGQALALATLWLAMTSRGPSIVMLDEPETSLSPIALSTMLRCIDSEMAQGRQVLVTTHSPYVLQWAIRNDHLVQQVRAGAAVRTWQDALRAQAVDPATVYDGSTELASTVKCCALLETWLTG